MILKIKCRPVFSEALQSKGKQYFIVTDAEDIETGRSKNFLQFSSGSRLAISLPILSEHIQEHCVTFYKPRWLFTYYYEGDDKFDYSKEYTFYIICSYSVFKNPFSIDWKSVDYYNNFYFKYLDEVFNTQN